MTICHTCFCGIDDGSYARTPGIARQNHHFSRVPPCFAWNDRTFHGATVNRSMAFYLRNHQCRATHARKNRAAPFSFPSEPLYLGHKIMGRGVDLRLLYNFDPTTFIAECPANLNHDRPRTAKIRGLYTVSDHGRHSARSLSLVVFPYPVTGARAGDQRRNQTFRRDMQHRLHDD